MTDMAIQTLDEKDNFDWCEQAIRELAQSKGITKEECERRFREWIDTLNTLDWLDNLHRQEESGHSEDETNPLPW